MKIVVFLGIFFVVFAGCTTPTEQDTLVAPIVAPEPQPTLQPESDRLTQAAPIPEKEEIPERVVPNDSVEGPELEELYDCESDPECTVHSVCANNTCHPIEGRGRNSCSTDLDCFDMHLACVDNACTLVEGRGDATCFVDSDCGTERKTHLVCANNACTRVPGPGRDRCWDAVDCTEKHMGCLDTTCIIRPGKGPNTCFSDVDCGGMISEEDAR
jgi:hypothetical protein